MAFVGSAHRRAPSRTMNSPRWDFSHRLDIITTGWIGFSLFYLLVCARCGGCISHPITTMAVDPAIVAVFGAPPSSLDLTDSRVSVDNAVAGVILCLAVVSVLLRFVARHLLRNPLKADDWVIILALVRSIHSFTDTPFNYAPADPNTAHRCLSLQQLAYASQVSPHED